MTTISRRRLRHAPGPWVALGLIVGGALLGAGSYFNVLVWAGAFEPIAFLVSGPLILAGLIVAGVQLARGNRPILLSVCALLLGIAALGCIGIAFLHVLAMAAFA